LDPFLRIFLKKGVLGQKQPGSYRAKTSKNWQKCLFLAKKAKKGLFEGFYP